MQYITPIELKEKLDQNANLTMLDIREPYELDICNIGGLQIPMGDIEARIEEIDANSDVIVVCKSGRRAQAVANLLTSDFEMNSVTILEGGILRWIEDVDNSLEAY